MRRKGQHLLAFFHFSPLFFSIPAPYLLKANHLKRVTAINY